MNQDRLRSRVLHDWRHRLSVLALYAATMVVVAMLGVHGVAYLVAMVVVMAVALPFAMLGPEAMEQRRRRPARDEAMVAGAVRVIEEERAAKGLPPLPPGWLYREQG
jgi:NhaP-type Na+/H+ or K+/H+ antiporter